MARKQRSSSETDPRTRRFKELMRRRKDLLHELGQVEGELEQIGSVQQRRAEAVKALRNSVKWVGDVESSVNVDWDAEQ